MVLGWRFQDHNALWSIDRISIYKYGLCSVPSAHAFNFRSHQCANVCLGKYSLGPNCKCVGDFMPTSSFAKMANDTITNIHMSTYKVNKRIRIVPYKCTPRDMHRDQSWCSYTYNSHGTSMENFKVNLIIGSTVHTTMGFHDFESRMNFRYVSLENVVVMVL